jgi:glucose-1-phosphate thymidylyltransferase
LGVNITYVVQDGPRGLAKAIEQAKIVIDEPFLVILGDNYLEPKSFAREMAEYHEKEKAECTIGICRVEDPSKFGIVEVEGNRVIKAVEKPERSKSDLGIAGVYVFDPIIFEMVKKLKPGKKGEYQLTDAIELMISEGRKVVFKELKGKHIDVGTFEALRKLQLGDGGMVKNL